VQEFSYLIQSDFAVECDLDRKNLAQNLINFYLAPKMSQTIALAIDRKSGIATVNERGVWVS
jgi:hypothetical protein